VLGRLLIAAFVVAAANVIGDVSLGSPDRAAEVRTPRIARLDVSPPVEPPATPSPSPSPVVESSPTGPEPTVVPSLAPLVAASPVPQPVVLATPSIIVQLGKLSTVRVSSPPSGLLTLSGFDPDIVRATFNAVDRTVDVTGLHTGATTITAADQDGLSATLAVRVEILAGRVADTASATITGNPAGPDFVAEAAIAAVRAVAYPDSAARLTIEPSAVTDAHTLASDDVATVHVPVSIAGDGMLTLQKRVAVTVTNIAQPRLAPRFLLVSDFPETLTENGTLFYADVNPDSPARLLYYHYAQKPETRRVIVKVQNNGVVASLVQLIAGVAGPDSNVLAAGHLATRRYLEREAANEGQIFEVPPHATLNVLDQEMPPETLITGVMQLRVVSGDGVRVALVAQDAGDSPVQPISDTLLLSAVRHARGVYSVPDFFYDETYTIGDPATVLTIGKLPLPNLVQGEVLGGDYGVKQSATVTLLNPGSADARVGMWFEPRGGRATGTFFVDSQILQIHAVDFGHDELLQTFIVPAGGYHQVSVTTMPEGGSSYPVNVIFSSTPPSAGTWVQSTLVY
jgi:hypothetical protein